MKILQKVRAWQKQGGKTVRFTDGKVYTVGPNGAAKRLSPLRPWRGKSERRQIIKARRAARNEDFETAERIANSL